MTTFADELNNLGNALLTSAQEMRKLLGQNDYAKYQKIGSNLSNLARSYSDGVMRLMEYGGTPQEFRQFKEVASDVMKSIDNIRDSSSYYYEKAGKAVERAEKVAQRIEKGSALASIAQLGLAMKEAAQTGNYDKLGEAGSEVLGSWLGGLAGAAIGGAVVALGAPAIVVAIMAGIGAWLGAELGELVWNKLFKPAQDWLSDKFEDWFGLNRTGLFHIYDPLVLDLDGDGIELVNANGWNGVQFDFNGNGIKTATQWVKADDGLLVWDRNGNGVIDDGSELFGQDTPHKYITEPVTDGFSALKTVESVECKNSAIWAVNDTIFAFQVA
ncbi:MAG: hypothetical protein IJV35_04690 [Neisseriaceae bacterium]|nr:hypothetical protein [Neisseriaceae bacterium]